MDGEVGNDHKVAIDIHKSRLNSVFRSDNDSAGCRERSVQPRSAQHAAVLLDIEFHILLVYRDLRIRLDLEYRRITVTGHDLKSGVVCLRNPESDYGRIISGDKISLASLKIP